MYEHDLHDRERRREAREADRARGSRRFAVLPWRRDDVYRGRDVVRWFRARPTAEAFAQGLPGGGRGVVVREWTSLRDPDDEAVARTSAQLEAEIAAAMRAYGY
jgi:hypothetical protein